MIEWYDLNARQLAAFLWSLVALIILFMKFPDIRRSLRSLLLSFFKPAIVMSVAGLLLITAAVSVGAVFVGRRLGAFETLPVVTTIIWSCTSGLSLMVAKISNDAEDKAIAGALIKTLAPATILSILLTLSVMGIWWEIATFPLVTAFGVVAAISSLKEELSRVARWMNFAFLLWVLAMVSRTVYSLTSDANAWVSFTESLAYPLWLTVGALPYILAIAQYDRLRFIIGCPHKRITADEYGDLWPLTVDEAKLYCRHSAVWIKVNRRKYGLNGLSYGLLRRHGYTVYELEDIWRPNPEIEGLKVSIGPLISDGLRLENRE